jgi:hypothetical protein
VKEISVTLARDPADGSAEGEGEGEVEVEAEEEDQNEPDEEAEEMQQWQKRRGEAPEMDGMEGSNDAEDF